MKNLLVYVFQGEQRQRWLEDSEDTDSVVAELKDNKLVSNLTVYELKAVEEYERPPEPETDTTVRPTAPEAKATAVPETE